MAKAPVSELRQLNVKSVDVFACMEILRHLANFPMDVSHPKFEHLFLYSISRKHKVSMRQLAQWNGLSKTLNKLKSF